MTAVAINLQGQQRKLAFTMTFRDMFLPDYKDPPISVPLTIEALGQHAYAASDSTYRISLAGLSPTIPTGTFPVNVTAPGGEYMALNPIEVTLPLAASVPPSRTDFLIVETLLPTRLFPAPFGESIVIGVIVKSGIPQPGLKIKLHESTPPSTKTVEATTNAIGEFVYRFPYGPKKTLSKLMKLHVSVNDGLIAVPVEPAKIECVVGQINTFIFNRL